MCSKIKCTRIWRELRSDVVDSINLSRPCSDPRRCERWPAEGRNGGRVVVKKMEEMIKRRQ